MENPRTWNFNTDDGSIQIRELRLANAVVIEVVDKGVSIDDTASICVKNPGTIANLINVLTEVLKKMDEQL